MTTGWGYDDTLLYAVRGSGIYDDYVWISTKGPKFELTCLCACCFQTLTGLQLEPGEYCTFKVE